MSGQYFAATRSKAYSVAISLSVTRHKDLVTILKELASDPASEVQWFSALPAEFQERAIGVWGLNGT